MPTVTRFRILRAANSYYLCGRVPLMNVIVLLTEMAGLAFLAFRFDLHFASKPVLTMMITNSILHGVADTIAQTVSSIRAKALRKPLDSSKRDGISIEIHDLSEKGPLPSHRGDLTGASTGFDFERLVRFMAWGFLMAPITFTWFGFLSEIFPVTTESQTGPALLRVASDQLIFTPICNPISPSLRKKYRSLPLTTIRIALAIFFIYMTLAEGGGKKAVMRKFSMVYTSALKMNYLVWPAVQIINFRLVPLALQLPFASTIGIAWTTYLSLSNDTTEL